MPKKVSSTSESSSRAPLRNWQGLIYTIFSAVVIATGTYFAIRWAQGDYRVDQNVESFARETGLLHATSSPKGAEVYIDGKLTSITDNTIYLAPGEYDVRIAKDGYNSWSKRIKIEKSLVSTTNATLYPYSPSITSITYTGVTNPLASPDGTKILYYTNTASARSKNGLYVLDVTNLSRSPQQICDDDPDFDLVHADILWSPDSNDVLVFTPVRTFLLNTSRFVNLQSSPDVSLQLNQTFSAWESDIALREQQFAEKIPLSALDIIRQNAKNIYLSPDLTKIVYTATASATIPDNLIAALPAPNSQPQTRTLTPDKIYVYDAYEDRNYLLTDAEETSSSKNLLTSPVPLATHPVASAGKISHQTLQADNLEQTITNFQAYYGAHTHPWIWLPDSTHLVAIVNSQIVIISYDGTNSTTVYSGPFAGDFILPSPNGHAILILTAFNPASPDNIYAIELDK